jgi:hypothetical protein
LLLALLKVPHVFVAQAAPPCESTHVIPEVAAVLFKLAVNEIAVPPAVAVGAVGEMLRVAGGVVDVPELMGKTAAALMLVSDSGVAMSRTVSAALALDGGV